MKNLKKIITFIMKNLKKIITFIMKNLERIITCFAYFLLILSMSTFPTLISIKYLRKYKNDIFNIKYKGISQTTYFENFLVFGSVVILFVLLPILLIKITEYKNNFTYAEFAAILILTLYVLGSLANNKGEIDAYIVICIYLFFCIFAEILSGTIRAIYKWLWTTKIEAKGKKAIIKKELDVKKIALIWAILSTIISLLFGFKK